MPGVSAQQLLMVECVCALAAGMYCLSAGGAGATSVLAAGINPIFGTRSSRRCCGRELNALPASHAVLPVEILHLIELLACSWIGTFGSPACTLPFCMVSVRIKRMAPRNQPAKRPYVHEQFVQVYGSTEAVARSDFSEHRSPCPRLCGQAVSACYNLGSSIPSIKPALSPHSPEVNRADTVRLFSPQLQSLSLSLSVSLSFSLRRCVLCCVVVFSSKTRFLTVFSKSVEQCVQ